jgi:chemotaxis response regulator CheB
VVGIGASAGGVRALQQLFDAMPEKTGAGFVVVVHLDPEMRSEMSNILAARIRMPVAQVETPVPSQADHVYIIPPDRRLHITNDELANELPSICFFAHWRAAPRHAEEWLRLADRAQNKSEDPTPVG